MKRPYRYIAANPDGFVRHLVTNIIRHGYRFYMTGEVKPGRDLEVFDDVMQQKFNYRMSRSERNRRKSAVGPDGNRLGLANVHYLRFERFWILIATPGIHPFFDAHTKKSRNGEIITRYFRDVHRDPIFFQGYSIRYAEGDYLPRAKWKNPNRPEHDTKRRVRVRIAESEYTTIKADFIERAKSAAWSPEALEAAVWNLPYLPFRPVREQLWKLVYWMNQARKRRGLPGMLNAKRCVRRKIPAVSALAVQCG